jgi:serine/threonine protein kinase
MLADRFRIVALLGKGGMGEVYRAEDIKLGQQVALKFLPKAGAEKLERFYGEVRLGRQVSHPNVCRIYDVFELGRAPLHLHGVHRRRRSRLSPLAHRQAAA